MRVHLVKRAAGAALLALLAPAPAHAQAEPSVEDAVLVLGSDEFLAALGSCLPAAGRPAEITMSIRVDATGATSLLEVSPPLGAQATACADKAVASLSFPDTVRGIEITFAVPVEDLPLPPAPPPQPAQPKTAPLIASPLAPPVYYAPVYVPPTSVKTGPSWQELEDSGRRKLVAGAVILPIGGVLFTGGILMGWAADRESKRNSNDDTIDADEAASVPTLVMLSAISILGGLAMMTIGSVLLGIGKRRLGQAERMKAGSQGFLPTPSLLALERGASLTLTWTF